MEFISTKNKRLARALICREAEQRDWARNPYIGLSRELNRRIRHHFAGANNRFVQRVWGYQWGQIFATEHLEEPRYLAVAEWDEIHLAIQRI